MNISIDTINSILYQIWRFIALNVRILKGVHYSKHLPAFDIKYKISYMIEDNSFPNVISNSSKPPQVGKYVEFGDNRFVIDEIGQILNPRGEFCYLKANCKFVSKL